MTIIQDNELRKMRLEKATQFGRQGYYEEAHQILGELGGRNSVDPDLLDLLARIYAQQGELTTADECWARALELVPDECGPKEGRRLIAEIRIQRYRRRTGRVVGGVILATALLVGMGVAGGAVAVTIAERDANRQVDELRAKLSQVVLGPNRALDDIHRELDGSKLILRSEPGVLIVTFPLGLFDSGATLLADGQQILVDFGKRISGFNGMSFTIVGHTDDIPVVSNSRYADNIDLGFSRARVVARQLAIYSRLPLTMFAVTSSGATNPPYSNEMRADREKNRTVTLYIRPMRVSG